MAISSNGLAGLKPGVVDNAAARPSSPFEGQMVYQKDTDQLLVWNGTAWRILASATATSGSVLQIQAGSTNTQTGKNNGTYATTTLSAAIAPQSTSNKVLVMFTHVCSTDTAGNQLGIRLVQRIGVTDTVIQTWTYALSSTTGGLYGSFAQNVLVSPSSTASVTYFTEMALTGGGGNVYTQTGSTFSNMVLQEIAG